MTQINVIDIQLVAAMGLGLVLICCLLLFYSMRDRTRLSPHNDALVYCPTLQRYAVVDFGERGATGTADRQLEYCSLLAPGARCNQVCMDGRCEAHARSGGKQR